MSSIQCNGESINCASYNNAVSSSVSSNNQYIKIREITNTPNIAKMTTSQTSLTNLLNKVVLGKDVICVDSTCSSTGTYTYNNPNIKSDNASFLSQVSLINSIKINTANRYEVLFNNSIKNLINTIKAYIPIKKAKSIVLRNIYRNSPIRINKLIIKNADTGISVPVALLNVPEYDKAVKLPSDLKDPIDSSTVSGSFYELSKEDAFFKVSFTTPLNIYEITVITDVTKAELDGTFKDILKGVSVLVLDTSDIVISDITIDDIGKPNILNNLRYETTVFLYNNKYHINLNYENYVSKNTSIRIAGGMGNSIKHIILYQNSSVYEALKVMSIYLRNTQSVVLDNIIISSYCYPYLFQVSNGANNATASPENTYDFIPSFAITDIGYTTKYFYYSIKDYQDIQDISITCQFANTSTNTDILYNQFINNCKIAIITKDKTTMYNGPFKKFNKMISTVEMGIKISDIQEISPSGVASFNPFLIEYKNTANGELKYRHLQLNADTCKQDGSNSSYCKNRNGSITAGLRYYITNSSDCYYFDRDCDDSCYDSIKNNISNPNVLMCPINETFPNVSYVLIKISAPNGTSFNNSIKYLQYSLVNDINTFIAFPYYTINNFTTSCINDPTKQNGSDNFLVLASNCSDSNNQKFILCSFTFERPIFKIAKLKILGDTNISNSTVTIYCIDNNNSCVFQYTASNLINNGSKIINVSYQKNVNMTINLITYYYANYINLPESSMYEIFNNYARRTTNINDDRAAWEPKPGIRYVFFNKCYYGTKATLNSIRFDKAILNNNSILDGIVNCIPDINCPIDRVIDYTTNECRLCSSYDANSTYISDTSNRSENHLVNGCFCKKNYYVSGNKCVQCPSNSNTNITSESLGNGCYCPAGYVSYNGSCILCSSIRGSNTISDQTTKQGCYCDPKTQTVSIDGNDCNDCGSTASSHGNRYAFRSAENCFCKTGYYPKYNIGNGINGRKIVTVDDEPIVDFSNEERYLMTGGCLQCPENSSNDSISVLGTKYLTRSMCFCNEGYGTDISGEKCEACIENMSLAEMADFETPACPNARNINKYQREHTRLKEIEKAVNTDKLYYTNPDKSDPAIFKYIRGGETIPSKFIDYSTDVQKRHMRLYATTIGGNNNVSLIVPEAYYVAHGKDAISTCGQRYYDRDGNGRMVPDLFRTEHCFLALPSPEINKV